MNPACSTQTGQAPVLSMTSRAAVTLAIVTLQTTLQLLENPSYAL